MCGEGASGPPARTGRRDCRGQASWLDSAGLRVRAGEGGNDSEAEAPSALGGDGDGDDITTDIGGMGGRAEEGAMNAGARAMPGQLLRQCLIAKGDP